MYEERTKIKGAIYRLLEPMTLVEVYGYKEPSRVGGMETALRFSYGPSLLAFTRRSPDLVSKC